MFVYRSVEQANLLHITGNEILNYVGVCIVVICGAIVVSLVLKKIITFVENKLQKNINGDLFYEGFDGQ